MRQIAVVFALLGAACAPGIHMESISPTPVERDYAACANADGETQQINRAPRGNLVVIVNNEIAGICVRVTAEGEAPFVYSKRIMLVSSRGQGLLGFDRYDRIWRVGPARNPQIRVLIEATDANGAVVARREEFLYIPSDRKTYYASIRKEWERVRIALHW